MEADAPLGRQKQNRRLGLLRFYPLPQGIEIDAVTERRHNRITPFEKLVPARRLILADVTNGDNTSFHFQCPIPG
jgi:hypothetical protein